MKNIVNFFKRLTLVPQGLIIVISSFLPLFAIVSMFPALPSIIDHFKDHPNARELVPLMVSAPGLAIALTASFAGVLVDKFGRVKPLLWATFFYGVFGMAPFFLTDLYMMMGSRFLLGFSEAVIITGVNTLIADYWEDEGRRDWLFLQGLAGPFLGAIVIRMAGPATEIQWNGVFLIYGVAFIIFALMARYLTETRAKSTPHNAASQPITNQTAAVKTPFPVGAMVLVGGVTLLASALYYVFIISGGLVFREIGINEPSRISELSAIPSLFVMVGALIFRLLGKQSNAIQLGALFAVLCSGLLIMGLADSVPVLLAGLVIQQTGAGMSVPCLIAWTQSKVTLQHRGRGMGIWASCFFFGQFSSPWLVAKLEGVVGSVQGAFETAGLVGIAAAVIALIAHISGRSKAKPVSTHG
ncbi:MAG: MFS transporter [Alteromonadaceae bacterium]|nr:MFS transporter [Alteromonadaceae bacterium]